MPRALRITMFFEDDNTGWSETHYDLVASDLTSAVNRALAKLIPARIGCLGDGPWLKYIRASYDDTFRDAQVFFVPPPLLDAAGRYQNNNAFKGFAAGEAWTACLLRGVGGDLYRKQIYLSGTPYSDQFDAGAPQKDALLVSFINYYGGVLTGQGYGFPIWRRDIQTFPQKGITAIQAVAPFTITIPNHGFTQANGFRVYLSKMKFLGAKQRHDGPYLISQIVDANNIILAGFFLNTGELFLGGFAQQQQKDVTPYTQVLIERFTHRKRGRPFDSPRGRSRARSRSLAS